MAPSRRTSQGGDHPCGEHRVDPTYEEAAEGLLGEAGLEDRAERRVMDFAQATGAVEAADIVIMNRVICCYPDMPKLVGAAADHTREVLVVSFPKERWWTKALISLGDLALRVARQQFQISLHPPDKIVATAERHGLKTVSTHTSFVWEVASPAQDHRGSSKICGPTLKGRCRQSPAQVAYATQLTRATSDSEIRTP